jgi:threonine/homoserine/homoserine lactone efflux protein
MIRILLQCIFVGFAVSMPVGPIGVTCIEHGFRGGFRLGIAAGLGAALADSLFGIVGASGIGVLFAQIKDIAAFRLIGACVILLLGLKTFLTPMTANGLSQVKLGRFKAFATTFMLTLSNPMTILCFSGIIASIGFPSDAGRFSVMSVGLGIFLGSALWWLLLAAFAGMAKARINSKFLLWISSISGVLLIIFGLVMLSEAAYHFIQ